MYAAIVARLTNVRKHPNADRLQLATVCGEQIIVGLNDKEGDLGLYFPSDGQLSVEFATHHDLVQRVEDGKRAGGFFSKNRQVRAQNFRGEKSYGFWMPISCLEFTGGGTPEEGTEITTWSGVPICNKFVTEATIRAQGKQTIGNPRKKNVNFPEHVDTAHLAKSESLFRYGSVVYVTEKLHGTSQRVGNVLEEEAIPRTLLDRLLRRTRTRQVYKRLIGTRRQVLRDRTKQGFYGSEEYRWNCVSHFFDQLKEGEVVYGEVVGYTNTGRPIMGRHSTKELPNFKDAFGDTVTYEYGCEEYTCAFYAYRITQHGVELSWPQVQQRCHELNINVVPELHRYIHNGTVESPYLMESSVDPSHPAEGVVYRIENEYGTKFVKDKTWEFKVMEGIAKSSDDYVDTEESA